MNKSEEYSVSRESEHVKYMVENTPKREKVNRTVSAAQALYDNRHKDPEAYEAYLNRPMVTKEQAQVLDADGEVFVNERTLSTNEIMTYHGLRQASKNTLGDSFSEGSSSSSEQRKLTAISAFTCTPPAELTEAEKAKVAKLEELVTIERKITLIERIKEKTKEIFGFKKHRNITRNKYGDYIYQYDEDKND